jgi:hypothetical protein
LDKIPAVNGFHVFLLSSRKPKIILNKSGLKDKDKKIPCFFADESHSKIILKDIVIAVDGDSLFNG